MQGRHPFGKTLFGWLLRLVLLGWLRWVFLASQFGGEPAGRVGDEEGEGAFAEPGFLVFLRCSLLSDAGMTHEKISIPFCTSTICR